MPRITRAGDDRAPRQRGSARAARRKDEGAPEEVDNNGEDRMADHERVKRRGGEPIAPEATRHGEQHQVRTRARNDRRTTRRRSGTKGRVRSAQKPLERTQAVCGDLAAVAAWGGRERPSNGLGQQRAEAETCTGRGKQEHGAQNNIWAQTSHLDGNKVKACRYRGHMVRQTKVKRPRHTQTEEKSG